MTTTSCQVVGPSQLWTAAETLSPRVRRLRDQYWSFYERECTNEVRAYTTGTPWDIVYSRERFDLGTNRWRIISSKNKARQLYIRSIRSNWRVLQTVIAGRARIY
jgi:hypothetical protein